MLRLRRTLAQVSAALVLLWAVASSQNVTSGDPLLDPDKGDGGFGIHSRYQDDQQSSPSRRSEAYDIIERKSDYHEDKDYVSKGPHRVYAEPHQQYLRIAYEVPKKSEESSYDHSADRKPIFHDIALDSAFLALRKEGDGHPPESKDGKIAVVIKQLGHSATGHADGHHNKGKERHGYLLLPIISTKKASEGDSSYASRYEGKISKQDEQHNYEEDKQVVHYPEVSKQELLHEFDEEDYQLSGDKYHQAGYPPSGIKLAAGYQEHVRSPEVFDSHEEHPKNGHYYLEEEKQEVYGDRSPALVHHKSYEIEHKQIPVVSHKSYHLHNKDIPVVSHKNYEFQSKGVSLVPHKSYEFKSTPVVPQKDYEFENKGIALVPHTSYEFKGTPVVPQKDYEFENKDISLVAHKSYEFKGIPVIPQKDYEFKDTPAVPQQDEFKGTPVVLQKNYEFKGIPVIPQKDYEFENKGIPVVPYKSYEIKETPVVIPKSFAFKVIPVFSHKGYAFENKGIPLAPHKIYEIVKKDIPSVSHKDYDELHKEIPAVSHNNYEVFNKDIPVVSHKGYEVPHKDIPVVSHKSYEIQIKDIPAVSHKGFELLNKDFPEGSYKHYEQLSKDVHGAPHKSHEFKGTPLALHKSYEFKGTPLATHKTYDTKDLSGGEYISSTLHEIPQSHESTLGLAPKHGHVYKNPIIIQTHRKKAPTRAKLRPSISLSPSGFGSFTRPIIVASAPRGKGRHGKGHRHPKISIGSHAPKDYGRHVQTTPAIHHPDLDSLRPPKALLSHILKKEPEHQSRFKPAGGFRAPSNHFKGGHFSQKEFGSLLDHSTSDVLYDFHSYPGPVYSSLDDYFRKSYGSYF